jgi:hypothetical protein
MPPKKIRVILFGLGAIGSGIARVLAERPDYQFVGAVDVDPNKVGCDLGQVIGIKRELGVVVSDNLKKTLARRAEVLIHATGSYLQKVLPELEAGVSAKHNIVSTCEELSDPWAQNAKEAKALDRLAKEMGVSVLGTGINPGFAMDTLPLTLTAACQQVAHVRVRRVVDASKRRMQLQKKIGTGLSPAAFAEAAARREIRHVGLTESASLIARGLGWKLDSIQETIEPVLATRHVVTDHFTVEPRFVTGVNQVAHGLQKGVECITLELRMSVDAEESSDEVWIEGHPNLHALVKGIHGDVSTAAVAANAARRIVDAPPGLLTMLDLPLVSAR